MREIIRLGVGAADVAVRRSRRSLPPWFITFVNRLKEVKFYCLHVCFVSIRPLLLTETWFSCGNLILVPTRSTIRCLTFSCDWHLISSCTTWIQQQNVENKHFSHCPITACCPQTNRKPYRATMSRQEFLSPHPQESQLRLARADAWLWRLHTACFVSICTCHQESSTPLMPYPGFIYHWPTEAIQWEHIVRI